MPPVLRNTAACNVVTQEVSDEDSSRPANGNAKTRRSHRKSRNGCTECKRRHIRCDERQPDCANCEVAERTCVYPPPKQKKLKQRRHDLDLLERRRPPDPVISPAHSSPASHSEAAGAERDVLIRSHHYPQHHYFDPYTRQAFSLPNPKDLQSRTATRTLPPLAESSTSNINNPPQQQVTPSPDDSVVQPPSSSQTHQHSGSHPAFSGLADETATTRFTAQHLVLLHHAFTASSFTGPDKTVVKTAVSRAVDSPYLIDEVLALTAFHMSILYRDSASSLRHQAMELQTRAVAGFTKLVGSVPNDDEETCIPRFLFAGVLSLHVLADTLAHYRSDFYVFIDRFTECFNLHRGIRVINRQMWNVVYGSDLKPMLAITRDADLKAKTSAHECAALKELMKESDLNASSIAACQDAIGCLQWAFDVSHHLEPGYKFHVVSAFSVKVDVEYVEVLRKHRPEALVILAYFAVLLHRSRSYWAFGDAGACMIRNISKHLGSYWQKALKWPLEQLEHETD